MTPPYRASDQRTQHENWFFVVGIEIGIGIGLFDPDSLPGVLKSTNPFVLSAPIKPN